MSALSAAWQAGLLAFNEQAMTPIENVGWGDRDSRLYRYQINQSYYNGNPYGTPFASANISRAGLYKYIRPIFMPHARLVELYVGEVYGGSLDMDDLSDGAIPIETEFDELRQQLIQLYRNSNWQSDKSLYVRFGSMLGDVAVKVVDNRQMQQVYLEVLHPGKIHTVERNSAGDIEFVRIEYERGDIDPTSGNTGPRYIYAEEITPDEFRTFRDGQPFAYFQDAIGRNVDNWRNEYGFVPLEVVQHRDMGLGWGASAFHHTRHKVDEINDAWSLLNDNVRKAVNIMWFFKTRKNDLDITRSQRDQVPMLFSSPEAQDPFPMTPNIDISAAGQNVLNLIAEVERDMPELALHALRDQGNATAPGIRAAWSDAIDRIVEARGNYDGGMIRLNKMGVYMGALMRYPGFEAVRYRSLEDERLEHQIAERAVIEDQLTELEQITLLRDLPDKPEQARLILERLNVPEKTIDALVAEIQGSSQQAMLQPGSSPNGQPPQLMAGEGAPEVDDDVVADVNAMLAEFVGSAA